MGSFSKQDPEGTVFRVRNDGETVDIQIDLPTHLVYPFIAISYRDFMELADWLGFDIVARDYRKVLSDL